MEATAGPPSVRADIRHGAVRLYLDSIMRNIHRAAAIYELHRNSDATGREMAARRIGGHMLQANLLARNGLPLLASFCGKKLPLGWADGVIDHIRTVGLLMDLGSWGGGRTPPEMDDACDRITEHLLLLQEYQPPEPDMPDLIFDPAEGLRLREPETRALAMPPRRARRCRVGIQGGEYDGKFATIDGVEVEPPLTPKSYRLLSLLIADDEGGGDGLTMEDLGDCRPGMSELAGTPKGEARPRYPHWDAILSSPGKKRGSNCPGVYRIKAA
jgi:hypothetical protein